MVRLKSRGTSMPAPAKKAAKEPANKPAKKPAMSAEDIAELLCGISAGVLSGLRPLNRARRLRRRARALEADAGSLRPGGTISGPTMMELADFAMYVAVFSAIGPQPLAVTTNLTINFLRKPARADLIAAAKLMKVGKRLAVGEVTIYSEGSDGPVAHVTATYSIPQQG